MTVLAGAVSSSQALAQLQSLEQEISHSDDPALWLRYADALYHAERYQHAAQAYAYVLNQEPYHHKAQMQRTLALAQAGDADALYTWLQALSLEHPLTATELFSLPPLRPFLDESRFQELLQTARAQAVD